MIALATQHIYMAPVSAIGAAAPVLATGEDLPATAREKTISYWSALIRGSALKNGHNPDVGEAFMNKEKEVKEQRLAGSSDLFDRTVSQALKNNLLQFGIAANGDPIRIDYGRIDDLKLAF